MLRMGVSFIVSVIFYSKQYRKLSTSIKTLEKKNGGQFDPFSKVALPLSAHTCIKTSIYPTFVLNKLQSMHI